jgi:hypothetical protein
MFGFARLSHNASIGVSLQQSRGQAIGMRHFDDGMALSLSAVLPFIILRMLLLPEWS